MRKNICRLLSILSITIILAYPCKSADYLGSIQDAISNIEAGAYDKAAPLIEKAFMQDDSDPLGNMAKAVLYMHTGKLSESEKEFKVALSATTDDWHACYALGVIAAVRGDSKNANIYFDNAVKQPDSREELAALTEYLALFNAAYRLDHQIINSTVPLMQQTNAVKAIRASKYDEAIALLLDMLKIPASSGYDENRSPFATFNASQPIALQNGKLTWKPTEHKNAPVVSGRITLNVDTGKRAGVIFVTVHIDDSFAGVTNDKPFQFSWNTLEYTNGLHKIKMEGKDQSGVVLSKKEVWVRVNNEARLKETPRSGPIVDELYARLWRCVKVSESRKFAHYQLAKLYIKGGDFENAVKHLEDTLVYKPDYADARSLLNTYKKKLAAPNATLDSRK